MKISNNKVQKTNKLEITKTKIETDGFVFENLDSGNYLEFGFWRFEF